MTVFAFMPDVLMSYVWTPCTMRWTLLVPVSCCCLFVSVFLFIVTLFVCLFLCLFVCFFVCLFCLFVLYCFVVMLFMIRLDLSSTQLTVHITHIQLAYM